MGVHHLCMCSLQLNNEAGRHAVVQKNEQVNYWPSNVEHTDEVESDKATEPREVCFSTPISFSLQKAMYISYASTPACEARFSSSLPTSTHFKLINSLRAASNARIVSLLCWLSPVN